MDLSEELRALRSENAALKARLRTLEGEGLKPRPSGKNSPRGAGGSPHTRVGHWQWEMASGEVTWSPEVFSILGLKPGQVEPDEERFYSHVHPDDLPGLLEVQKRVFDTGVAPRHHVRVIREGGDVRQVMMEGALVRSAQGEVLRVVGTLLDVTEQKAYEADLEQANFLLSEAQELANAGHFVLNLSRGVIEFSPGLWRILGRAPQDAPSMEATFAWVHPDDRARVMEAFGVSLQESSVQSLEYRLVRPNGEVRHVFQRSRPMRLEGGANARIGMVQDVTGTRNIQDRLHRANEQLKEAQHLAHMGSWTWDLQTGVMTWSDELKRWFDYTSEDSPGAESVLSAVHPEDRERIGRMMAEIGSRKDPMEIQFRILLPSGQVRHVIQRSRDLPHAPEDARMRMGAILDVTELHEANHRLERLNELLNLAQSMAKIGSWVLGGPGEAGVWTRELYTLLGFAPDVPPDPQRFMANIHPDDLQAVQETFGRVLAGASEAGPTEFRYQRPSGGMLWMRSTIRRIPGAGGKPDGLLGSIMDVTEARRSQDQLETSAFQLKEAQRVAGLGFWLLDPESRDFVWSEELCNILGFPPEIRPTPDLFLQHILPGDFGRTQFEDWLRRQGESGGSVVFRFRRPDGDIRHLTLKGRWLETGAQGHRQSIGVVLDVTEMKALEDRLRQSQKMEAIGRLAGGVAHDFNNLLTVILGNATLLSETHPHTRLSQIEQAAEMGAALTRKLLTFSRKAVIQPQPLNLSQVIQDMGGLLERLIGEDIRVQYELRPDLPPMRADITQVEQILFNLAANSRDAMPRGGTLVLATHAADRTIHLEVRDTGVGMEDSVVRQIFEPFFTTKESGQGTGLGLSTVREIVEQIGGHIRVSSVPGQGTAFYLDFPVDTGQGREASRVFRRPVGGHEKVWVVEDGPEVRQLVAEILEGAGYQVQTSANGQAALQALTAPNLSGGLPQLVVTDIMMPEMGGRTLYQSLKEIYPNIRFLFLSGYPGAELEGSAEAVFLAKPFTREELLSSVREALDGPAEWPGEAPPAR